MTSSKDRVTWRGPIRLPTYDIVFKKTRSLKLDLADLHRFRTTRRSGEGIQPTSRQISKHEGAVLSAVQASTGGGDRLRARPRRATAEVDDQGVAANGMILSGVT